jgi:uncharacterized integral membrane protein
MPRRSSGRTQDPTPSSRSGWRRLAVWLSLLSLATGLLLLFVFLSHARDLVSLGLVGQFYYPILVILGLFVAGFLFGALRSYAVYQGNHAFGKLQIAGPIVAVALVVVGGFVLPAPATNFPLTVYVHGPAGQMDRPIRNEGSVLLDLGGDPRTASIGDRGQALFTEIPASFRGQKVNVGIDAGAFERVDGDRLTLEGNTLYLPVRRKSAHVSGTVVDESGKAITGATVMLAGLSTTTGALGEFVLQLPSDRVGNDMLLRVTAAEHQMWTQVVIPDGGPISAVLRRRG